MADEEPVEKIIERAYFHVSNGGLTLSILEERWPSGLVAYRLKHEMSNFGVTSEGSFPLGSSDIVSWMNMALQRVSMKVAAAFHDRSFRPFEDPVDITHANGEPVAKLASLLRIVASYQRQAKEFSSPDALREYLHEHPQADKSLHSVKKPGEERHEPEHKDKGEGHGEGEHGHEEKPKKSWKERLQSISQAAKDFVKNAPENIKKFVEDDAHRRGVLIEMHKSLGEVPEKLWERAKHQVKHTAQEYKLAGQGVKTVLKGGKMTKEQKHAVKVVAFEAAMTVAVSAVTGGLGAGASGLAGQAAQSFVTSLAKKIALNAVTDGLGRVVDVEELGHLGHGIHHMLEHIVTADEGDKGEKGDEMDLITAYITKVVAEELKELDPDTLAEALEDASTSDSARQASEISQRVAQRFS